MRELEERRVAILKSIEEQGKLTPELQHEIATADTKTRLEDLYLPYKPKRRTKGQIAIEAGLEPLADALFNDPSLNPEAEAARYINAEKGVADDKAALDGAKYILMERFAEDANLLAKLRSFMQREASVSARVVPGKEAEGANSPTTSATTKPCTKSQPPALAILRGRNEGFLTFSLVTGDPEDKLASSPCETIIASHFNIQDKIALATNGSTKW